jgi:hypothetical protein
MEHIVRIQKHTDHEITLGHKVSYTHYEGGEKFANYAISITANIRGFVPLSAVLRHFDIPRHKVEDLVDLVNKEKVIRSFKYSYRHPTIILVPRTHGTQREEGKVEYYISEILSFCNYMNMQQLQFMHYSFINGKLQTEELRRILKVLLNPLVNIKLKRFVWEIDSRAEKQFMSIYNQVANNLFRLKEKEPKKIFAPEFEYVDDPKQYGNTRVQELRLKDPFRDFLQ